MTLIIIIEHREITVQYGLLGDGAQHLKIETAKHWE
jgi:hypothetical protein